MQRLRNIFDRLWATLMFFTRLPLWRVHEPERDSFEHVVEYWPMVGWITGGTLALCFAVGVNFLSLPVLAILVLASRLLMTGALHEDGLADFCDGMGGGNGRERIMQIMKDSHIGTYGVIGLILYFLTMYFGMREMTMKFLSNSLQDGTNPILVTATALLTMDVWSKFCASLLVFQLPYARKAEEAKSKVVYAPFGLLAHCLRFMVALIPVILLWFVAGTMPHPVIFVVPVIVELLLSLWLRRSLQGYTGDCCGAVFCLCEVSILLSCIIFC